MGTQTFGKASVQNIKPFSDGAAILLTVAKYQTPDGSDINKIGISPNIEVKIPTETIKAAQKEDYEYSQEKDTQLQAAIKEMQKLINQKK